MDGWMDGRINGWMYGYSIDRVLVDVCMCGLIDALVFMDACIAPYKSEHLNGRMDGSMDE